MTTSRVRPRSGSPAPAIPDQPGTAPTGAGRVGLDRLADRWSALLLAAVDPRPLRFAELRTWNKRHGHDVTTARKRYDHI